MKTYAIGDDGMPDYTRREQLWFYAWNVFKNYQQHARPFDFVTVGIISQDRKDIAARPRYCCKKPRPSCLLSDEPAQWRAQEWRCLGCGAAWDFDTFPRLRTYGEIVQRTLQKVDRKKSLIERRTGAGELSVLPNYHVERRFGADPIRNLAHQWKWILRA